MSERDLRRRAVHALSALDAVSVENHAYPGTPDLNYIEGWVELKWLRRWPRRDTSIVKIEHFTQEQRVWIRRRAHRGGTIHLLLQVGHEYLLFGPRAACEEVGLVRRGRLFEIAEQVWEHGMDWNELADLL